MTTATRPKIKRSGGVRPKSRPKKSSPKKRSTKSQNLNEAIESGVTKALKKTGAWGMFWHLIKFTANCGICLYVTEQSNTIADMGFAIRSNQQAIASGVDSCLGDPIGCIQGKYFPALRWGKPTDNITAMLDLVAWAEGTDSNYNMIYTGAKFGDYSRHPARIMCSAGICSDAAGRYQFLSTTWGPLADRLKLPDFSPASQDKAAIQLLKDNNCYGAAVRGDVRGVTDRCWTVWASLKSSSGQKLDDRQHAHSIEKLKAKYNEFLGSGKRSIVPPLAKMTLTSPMQKARRNPATAEVRDHNGADYACGLGEIVRAPIEGTFRQGNSDPNGFGDTWGSIEGEGQTVTIGHTRKLLIADGSIVAVGSPIAECGSEGISTGPHLHLEIRRGDQLVDPATEFDR